MIKNLLLCLSSPIKWLLLFLLSIIGLYIILRLYFVAKYKSYYQELKLKMEEKNEKEK